MFKNILLCVLFLNLSAYASNKAFNDDIKRYLEKDFYKFGIVYDDSKDKIIFTESEMLFQNGKNNLRKPFKTIIKSFFPSYINLLNKHKINIQSVIIKGHTSSKNRMAQKYVMKFELNKILSQQRADEFLKYASHIDSVIVRENFDWIKKNFISKGMSHSEPIFDQDGNEDESASRRIEIQIIFNKDLKFIKPSKIIESNIDDTKKLSHYVQRLLDESYSLKEKYNLLKSFESDIRIAKAAFYPTVSVNFRHTDYSESTPDNFTDTQSKDIMIRYNIFNGFKDIEETNIKKYTYIMNQYLNEQIESDLIYSLVDSFINIKKQKDILELAKINLLDYDLWISKEDIKFQNGMISLRNYAKIQSRDTTQRMNYRELTKQYKDNISTFRRYLDFETKDIENLEDIDLSNKYIKHKDIAYYDIKRYSPYLKEARQIVKIYKEKLEQSKVHFYPAVNVTVKKSRLNENYETTSTTITNDTSIAIEASLELYSGGKDSANNEKKLFEYKEKVSKKKDVMRDVKYKLDLAFNKLDLTLEKDALLISLIEERENSLLGASYDYKFAKIDANGLLDNVDDLYSAKKMYIENKYDISLSKYKILNVIGIIKNIILEQEIKE